MIKVKKHLTEDIVMNNAAKLLLVGLGGIGVGVAAAELTHTSTKPPAFQIVEYEVTDPAGFQSYIKGADAIHSARVFLARHAQGTALSGEPPMKWIGMLRYPSLDDALAFDSSPEYTALKRIRDKSTKWRSFVVEGLPNQ
jgi:uncharacterized protein (DUF1330 family)